MIQLKEEQIFKITKLVMYMVYFLAKQTFTRDTKLNGI